mgnify:FL=1
MKKIKNNIYVLYTLLLSLLIILVFFYINNITPFGSKDFTVIDFYHQYFPMTSELINRILNSKTLLFSFNGSLPFIRNLYNYLSSPFNILLLPFKDNLSTGFSLLIAIKAILASTTICYYLTKNIKNSILSIPISISYGFSSYYIAYHWNIMWLDGMIFLPLIILGLEKIIKENKSLLYIITLSISIFSNYYIGYMICIFTFIYFQFYYLLNYKFNIKDFLIKFKNYILYSIISIGIISIVVIPIYFSLSSISATKDTFPSIFETEFNIINFILNNFSLSKPTALISENIPLPNTSSSLLIFILIPLFFINKNINKKEKILYALLLLTLFLCMHNTFINFIWHGFHFPNDLPYRQSFIYIFITIIIAYKSLINIKYINTKKLLITLTVFILLIILSKIIKFDNLQNKVLIINTILLIIYFTILIINIKNKKYTQFALITIVAIETCISCVYNIKPDHNGKDLDNSIKNYQYIKNILPQENEFYRIEKIKHDTYNDPALNNYYGISVFSSMTYEDISKLQRKLGNGSNNINSYYYNLQTPIYNSMFNIKYLVGKFNYNKSFYKENKNEGIKEYKYPLSIAYKVNNNIKNWDTSSNNPFTVQESFIKESTGFDNMFNKLNINFKDIVPEITNNGYFINSRICSINLENDRNGDVYLYIDSNNLSSILVNGESYFIATNEPYIINLGYFSKYDDINVTMYFSYGDTSYNEFNIYAYSFNENNFKKAYNSLNDEILNISSFKENHIKGYINLKESGVIFTSIPYDNSWKIKVDNKYIDFYKIGESYIGFNLNEGYHNIEFIYKTKGLKTGAIISTISLISTIYLYIKKKLR